MTNDEEREYLNSLKPGERVIETGQSCTNGMRGTVYVSESPGQSFGSLCVKWDNGMGTSVTNGSRRFRDKGDFDKESPGLRAYKIMGKARDPLWHQCWENLHWEIRLHWERFAELYSKPIGPLGLCGCCRANPATEAICVDCIEKYME